MFTLSVDPGVKDCGVALWDEDGLLVRALLVRHKGEWYRMAAHVVEEFGYLRPKRLVVELPQVYRASRSKGNPNNLIKLAGVVGGLVTGFLWAEEITIYKPVQWKGNQPKSRTIMRVQDSLSEEEIASVQLPTAKSLAHNVWDGVGIGMAYWAQKGIRTW